MSINAPVIWMNVTTSVNWQREPVGIVRVERALFSEFAELYGARLKRCIWQDGEFIEWTPSEEKKESIIISTDRRITLEQQNQELPPIYPILTKRQALVAIVQATLSLVPKNLRPFFNKFLHFLRPKVGGLLRNTWVKNLRVGYRSRSISKNNLHLPAKLSKPISRLLFTPGDILISIGLDWDYPYYKEFYNLRKNTGIKIISCCYDLIPVLYPQYCVDDVSGKFISYFIDVADGSDLILCISKQSEKDLNAMLDSTGAARPKTQVFRLGDNLPDAKGQEISEQINTILQKPFILFVSTIERRKNHEVLYRAYHLLCKEGKKEGLPKLVFVGMQGWGVSELLKDIELDPLIRDTIISLNNVNDTELVMLYETALFCVFPSLYEGWGLPVSEALSLGKAVICSDRGSLPEVGGDLVRYLDPWNPQIWAEELYKMSTDDLWRAKWENRSRDLYATRSWRVSASEIKKHIDEMLD
jgi:glycosyltransferase involved in cell wall biosynthesis